MGGLTLLACARSPAPTSSPPIAAAPASEASPADEATPATSTAAEPIGGSGTRGTGSGGGGTGEGTIGLGTAGVIGRGTAKSSAPVIRPNSAEVKGALDKDVIRRIVRAHLAEVRTCYTDGLAREPSLRGRVAVKFTVGPTGAVIDAVVAEHDLPDDEVADCIVAATRAWTFPRPEGGGNVVITYPFVLVPG